MEILNLKVPIGDHPDINREIKIIIEPVDTGGETTSAPGTMEPFHRRDGFGTGWEGEHLEQGNSNSNRCRLLSPDTNIWISYLR